MKFLNILQPLIQPKVAVNPEGGVGGDLLSVHAYIIRVINKLAKRVSLFD